MTRAKRTTAEMLADARKKLDEARARLAAAQERVKELEARYEKEEREAAEARWARLAGGIESELGTSLTTEQIELAMKAAIAALSGDGGEGQAAGEGSNAEAGDGDRSVAPSQGESRDGEGGDAPAPEGDSGDGFYDDGSGFYDDVAVGDDRDDGARVALGGAGPAGQTLPISDMFFAGA